MQYNLREIERHGVSDEIPNEQLIIRMKARRNALLKQSDWTQMPDNPISNKQQWADYRQALRDFPETWEPSETVTFPDEPT